ncbi:TPA: RNA 2'-phosphotransferase [Yersinia enterocolitica]|uniref:RNA 2'-phosphotransferase n=1 Tax=Yersinia enterocolitica TaxID=630 RepID=UPI001CA4BD31|nr:RNA 2'-phosphotransferase [Yersinia enterocolitica]MBW5835893.1 RNA 2'-phosphotransferase [Yersinia enterocolitica]HEN3566315.1 RNA 2'-phosphotransferase [Yersinia enterocolitica]HEN3570760.1 RNA 2'-phosphotransferase [Yersinia enterocolitica]HEN3574341.1 RNA 2'-phosphotransferase [Yersinia enterocolitica]HEN3602621.1 RNA 2'-phosphotransferase [Yersinia enterocolitica]
MSKKNIDISKFLSYVLRHQPEAIGLSLDKEGWAIISDLILCSVKEGYTLDNNFLRNIVDNSDKKRFTISEDGLRIRAVQGHSTREVNIVYEEKTPPDTLYHGTATRFLLSIREQGLTPQKRQHVHLSSDKDTAFQVGLRYGKPVVLKIKTLDMYEQGFKFFQADNGVWLTDTVPYQFIQE